MPLHRDPRKKKWFANAVILSVAVLIAVYFLIQGDTAVVRDAQKPVPKEKETTRQTEPRTGNDPAPPALADPRVVEGKIAKPPAIDYRDLQMAGQRPKGSGDIKDKILSPGPQNSPGVAMMAKRKKRLGIKNSLDMIVRSDESFIVGGKRIVMTEILENAFTEKGEIFQERIGPAGEYKPQTIKEYGVYVVRPGDNIWNIHFNILTEYYLARGIKVEPKADEPLDTGLSSGVGKILKFSELIAIIYNIDEKKVVENINLIKPLNKLVIYNMEEVFGLLGEINYSNVDRIQFDGRTIWIPAKES